MKLLDLFEAPVGNLEVHNMDYDGTFPDADRRLLTNPDHIKRIRKHFERTPYTFDLYFINRTDRTYAISSPREKLGPNEIKTANFTQHWMEDLSMAGVADPKILKDLSISVQSNPDAISVIYLSNANSINSIPMTPWIIAHRFAHSLTDNRMRTLTPEMKSAMHSLPSDTIDWIYKDHKIGIELGDVLTMRSAKRGMLTSEVREELIAQYLMQGYVTLKVPDGAPLVVRSRISNLSQRINKTIKLILDQCVGKVFLTI